ncbi:MAG: hypothetical protein ACT4PK_09010 [Gammaproteobacteria bacterium]
MTLPAGAGPLGLPAVLARGLAGLGFVAGILLALPHLQDPVWQDEAYMLMNFSDRGFLYPFTDYHLPNNHVLFSALLALWSDPGDSVPYTRLLPLSCFVLALPLLYVGVERLAGRPAAIVALVLFAMSPVTRDFAAQLRGYAASWVPLSALLLLTPRLALDGRKASGVLYAISAVASVAILPTNLWFCLALALWGCALCLGHADASRSRRGARVAVLLGAPLLGLAAYVLVWEQLLAAANKPWGGWGYAAAGLHWIEATLSNQLWLLPVAVLGLTALARRLMDPAERRAARGEALLLLSLAASLGLMAALLRYPPLPRTYVPALPLWYAAVALVLAGAWRLRPLAASPVAAVGVFMAVVLGLFVTSWRGSPCGGTPPESAFPQDLCHAFYRQEYRPGLVAAALGALPRQDQLTVVTDDEAFWALSFLVRQGEVAFPLELVDLKTWEKEERDAAGVRPPGLVVTRSQPALEHMITGLGLSARPYREIADTGYFKLYAAGY